MVNLLIWCCGPEAILQLLLHLLSVLAGTTLPLASRAQGSVCDRMLRVTCSLVQRCAATYVPTNYGVYGLTAAVFPIFWCCSWYILLAFRDAPKLSRRMGGASALLLLCTAEAP